MNRKNKPILVKGPVATGGWTCSAGENFEKEFESITDTIKYFGTLNIKLNRKAIYLHLKDGKKYKDYSFYRK